MSFHFAYKCTERCSQSLLGQTGCRWEMLVQLDLKSLFELLSSVLTLTMSLVAHLEVTKGACGGV